MNKGLKIRLTEFDRKTLKNNFNICTDTNGKGCIPKTNTTKETND